MNSSLIKKIVVRRYEYIGIESLMNRFQIIARNDYEAAFIVDHDGFGEINDIQKICDRYLAKKVCVPEKTTDGKIIEKYPLNFVIYDHELLVTFKILGEQNTYDVALQKMEKELCPTDKKDKEENKCKTKEEKTCEQKDSIEEKPLEIKSCDDETSEAN